VRHNVSTLHDSPRPAMCLCFDALDKILLAKAACFAGYSFCWDKRCGSHEKEGHMQLLQGRCSGTWISA